jgi:hypothetical protein
MGIKRFEERIERAVEGSLTRPFRSALQPIEIGRRLTREMDLARRVGPRGLLVAPNVFTITLAPDDVERFSHYLDALVRELAEAAREHAEIEGYALLGPVEVDIFENSRLRPGRVEVAAEVQEGEFPCDLVLPDGRRIAISETPLVIGRLPDCDVVLVDPNVSRRHAEIVRVNGEIVVRDLGSTNGIKVNGSQVLSAVLLDGDELNVGASQLVVEAP